MSTSLRKDFVCCWNNYSMYTFACCLALQPTYPSRLGPRRRAKVNRLYMIGSVSFYKHTFMSEEIDPLSANFSDLGAVLPTKKLYKNLLQSTRLGWYMTKLLTYSLMGLVLSNIVVWGFFGFGEQYYCRTLESTSTSPHVLSKMIVFLSCECTIYFRKNKIT